MKILMISTDRDLFDPTSAVRMRMLEQSEFLDKLCIIVFAKKGMGYMEEKISRNIHLYPTNSKHKAFYLSDAYAIGKRILSKEASRKHWLVSTQDPFESGTIGYLLALFFRTSFHVQLHTDPFSDEWKKERLINRIRFLLALFLLHKADGVRVVSLRVFRHVRALGVSRECITKVPIYVDVAHFIKTKLSFDLHQSYGEYSHIVLSMGRLEHEKNFNKLIRAFRKVRQAFPDTLLLIAGNGRERERLLSLVRSFDLEKNVKIIPWARDVVSYYKTCDVYVQPSLYEGWGLAVVEAMASGAPVVMTDVGCAGEIVRNEETGLVIPTDDEDLLADAIDRLLADKLLRTRIAKAGRDEVKKLATKAETLMLYKTSWEQALIHGHKRLK